MTEGGCPNIPTVARARVVRAIMGEAACPLHILYCNSANHGRRSHEGFTFGKYVDDGFHCMN